MYIFPFDNNMVKIGTVYYNKLAIMLLHYPSNSVSIKNIFSNFGAI